jgi:two-component system, NtrC family, response regulator AtoC
MAKVLIIDDEMSILESLEMFFTEKNHTVFSAATAEEGLDLFWQCLPEIVFLDIRLPDMNGLDVLSRMMSGGYPVKIMMITAYHDMETTIEAMKRGAFDYIHKPLDAEEVEKAVDRALHILQVDCETPPPEPAANRPNPCVIIGQSETMRDIFKTIGLLCQNRATVLIQGETGTGKELIARVLHRNSLYQDNPFVVMDCSAVVETLLESELFGHEKGSFTGATVAKCGKIELAGKGTLFLDEVAQLPLGLQGKLMGFLQRREYTRVGGRETLASRCRIIAACNCDLAEAVRRGRFKEDLYFRLHVVTVRVPPLRERRTDIPLLVNHFIRKISHELETEPARLQKGVIERLMVHPWSGNVRELENVIVEAVVRTRGNVILVEDIDRILTLDGNRNGGGLDAFSLENAERKHICDTLSQLGWNRTRAAQALRISLPTLRSKIRKYAIEPAAAAGPFLETRK